MELRLNTDAGFRSRTLARCGRLVFAESVISHPNTLSDFGIAHGRALPLTDWKRAMSKRARLRNKYLQEQLGPPKEDLDDVAIARILKAVRHTPKDLDTTGPGTEDPFLRAKRQRNRMQLSYDIGLAETRCRTANYIRHRRRIRQQLELISQRAEQLKRLISADDTWTAIAPYLTLSRNFPDKLLSACDMALKGNTAIEDKKTAEEKAADQVVADQVVMDLKRQSSFETLVSGLIKIFEKHFNLPVKTTRPNDEKNDTPYMKFVRATLKEFGLSYADEAIISATSVARSGRGRRKAA
jgi:hypothetical protein